MPNEIHIVVDGIIYQHQPVGGISNLFNSILPRMCDCDPTLQVMIFYTANLQQALPSHAQIQHVRLPEAERYIRPRRYFYATGNTVRMQLARHYFKKFPHAIWHSTYFTYFHSWSGPSVVTVHDMIYERFPDIFNQPYDNYFRVQKRRCILDADIVICDSETTREDLEKYLHVDSKKLRVIYLACSSTFHRLDLPNTYPVLLDSHPYILFVGKRYHYKNFILLIRAFSRWRYRDQIKLVVAGDTPWNAQEIELITQLDLNNRIELKLSLSDEQLCHLYNGAVALVFPSIYEGFGMPLLEAINCGCPIVASRIPSTLEVAWDIPIYFDPSSVEDLVQALNLVVDEGRNSARVTRGFSIAQNYSWDITAKRTLEIYHSLL